MFSIPDQNLFKINGIKCSAEMETGTLPDPILHIQQHEEGTKKRLTL
jgi:hypothetical protein